MKNFKDKYFKVLTIEKSNEADLYLYGVIGNAPFFMGEPEDDLTDLEIVKTIARLEDEGKTRLNVRINSPGGSDRHGDGIIAALKNTSMEVHGYVDGVAASKAADIFLSIDKENRHMALNGKLMIHSHIVAVFGNAKDLREVADELDKFTEASIARMAKDIGQSEEEVKAKYFDYNDHWLTAKEALSEGLINAIEDNSSAKLPEDVEQMTLSEVMNHFQEIGDESGGNIVSKLFHKLTDKIWKQGPAPITQINTIEMNLEQFKKSLDDNQLDIDQVVATLQEKGFKISAPDQADPGQEAPTLDVEKIVQESVDAALSKAEEKFQEKIDALQAQVEQLGDLPGDKRTNVQSDGDQYSSLDPGQVDAAQGLDNYNKQMAERAKANNTTIFQ
jgi:ATP-dependent protease ClpP protease subunit/DNA-binding winged helix-turn-helix (wHTH) protein